MDATAASLPTQSYTYQVRAVDTSGNVSTPGSVNVGVFAVSDPTLIAAKSVWKYLDNGTDQGTAWRESVSTTPPGRAAPASSATAGVTKAPS